MLNINRMNSNSFISFNKKLKNKKKKFPKEYIGLTSKTFGIKQLNFYKRRLENIRLTWCQQVFEIIKKLNYSNLKLKVLNQRYY